jgi:hypothetical protein
MLICEESAIAMRAEASADRDAMRWGRCRPVALGVCVALRKAKQILPNGETKRRLRLRFGHTHWVNGRDKASTGKSGVGEQVDASKVGNL